MIEDRVLCPVCKSESVRTHSNPVTLEPDYHLWFCENCGFEDFKEPDKNPAYSNYDKRHRRSLFRGGITVHFPDKTRTE